jgi:hypothetical protein
MRMETSGAAFSMPDRYGLQAKGGVVTFGWRQYQAIKDGFPMPITIISMLDRHR